MRDIPKDIDDAFMMGKRTEGIPFAINDSVDIVSGPHADQTGAVIAIESLHPTATFRIELGNAGGDVIVPVSDLRHHETAG